jgi:hypothetical protein
MVGKTAALGALIVLGIAGGFFLLWGRQGAIAGATFGLLAVAIQIAAVALMRPAVGGAPALMFRRWGMGMALRLGGVVLIPVAVVAARTVFPPLPAAFGYLGTLIPLLFFEARLFR